MTRRMILPLLFGLIGAVVLIGLGSWQVQRLAWKEGVLAEIEARISDAPIALPANPDPEAHRYQPVEFEGRLGQTMLRVLVSRKQVGAGYRLIAPLSTGQGTVLIDLGFIKVDQPMPMLPDEPVRVTGNLHWPDDRNSSTPDNDVVGNLWFARDLDQMAEVLETQPILVVARNLSFADNSLTPLPVDTSSIPNDHLGYAITWFSLAVVWLGMTGVFVWRIRQKDRKGLQE